jgi:hypothetical protein
MVLPKRGTLLALLQHEHVELVAHEAAEGVFRRADDRLAADASWPGGTAMLATDYF